MTASAAEQPQGVTVGSTLPGLDEETHAAAVSALHSGTVAWVVISGKMAAGKDTVGPRIVDVLPDPSGEGPVLLGYGDLMREELSGLIDVYSAAYWGDVPVSEREQLLVAESGLRPEHARELRKCLDAEFGASSAGLAPSVFDRTENMRRMLQGLGGVWRTQDDPTYWVRKAAVAALVHAAAGRSVVLTGARYVPDVEIPARSGAILVRLDIDRDTQLARLGARDGIAPTPATLAALDHPGETALDDWSGFTFRVANTGPLEVTVEGVRRALAAELTHRQEVARSVETGTAGARLRREIGTRARSAQTSREGPAF